MNTRELTDQEMRAFRTARVAAYEAMPYFAAGLFSLVAVAAPGLGTFAVDRWWRLYLDPDMLLSGWSAGESGAVLLHELGHVLRVHADRAAGLEQPMDHTAWNLAADAEINDDLLTAGAPLPEGVITPEALDCEPNGIAEDYYANLLGRAELGSMASDDDLGCGSGAGTAPIPGELGGSVVAAGRAGIDAATADMVRRQIAESVRAHEGSGRGTVPAGVQRWASEVLAPSVVPWRRVLGGAVRAAMADAAGRTDYTYRRPSRRRLPGVILPALRGPKLTVSVVMDTSGSMSRSDLSAALSEIGGVLKSGGISGDRVTVWACDAETAEPQHIRNLRDVVLTGGGGTDMRIGIAAACKTRPEPQVVIVLTDGDTPWPERQHRNSRLVCVIIGNVAAASRTPDFAFTVTVPTSAVS